MAIIFTLSFLGVSFATVGWPSIIDNTYYDSDTNTIRYSQTFYDGFWWSNVYQYTIDTKDSKIITNLDNLEFEEGRLMSDIGDLKNYFIEKDFTSLQEFELDKSAIKVSLTLDHFNQVDWDYEWHQVNPFDYVEDDENYMMSWYVNNYWRINRIYIDNKVVSELPISTCRLDPINFRWLSLMEIDVMMIIATAAKSDCAEWWYIGEIVHIVPSILDSRYFLAENSKVIDFSSYEDNQTLKITKWWLRIQPEMEWDNLVKGLAESEDIWISENISFWEKIKNFITKILAYLNI